MRPRDPRRLLARRRELPARVSIVHEAVASHRPGEPVTSRQSAIVTLPREELDRIWTPEYLERLARTYWRYLMRISLGLLRIRYTRETREVVLLAKPLTLLRFRAPEYDIAANRGSVTWRIDGGLLVAPGGRGNGFLRVTVERPPDRDDQEVSVRVRSEVANFYPMLAGWGWFARIGRIVYSQTQLRIHVVVTHGFLRSLGRLDLEPSVVGALAPARREETAAAPRRG